MKDHYSQGKRKDYFVYLSPHKYSKYKNMRQIAEQWNDLRSDDSISGSYHAVLKKIKDKISKPAETARKKPSKYFSVRSKFEALLKENDKLIEYFSELDEKLSERLFK
jgi:predicted transcriptional regulator